MAKGTQQRPVCKRQIDIAQSQSHVICPLFSANLLFAVCLLLFTDCSPSLRTERFSFHPETEAQENKNPHPARSCADWRGYLPDTAFLEHLPMRYLRVNFHVMNSRDSSHNYRPAEGREQLIQLLALANQALDTNMFNWRSPEGTPILPRRYRYVLAPQPGDDGIYFHYDDSLYYFISSGKYQNNYSRKVIDKYTVGKDSILNIFVMVHPDDSIRSPTYRANRQGISLGTAVKIAGMFEHKAPPIHFIGLLNHEIGHSLSLSHAWTEDGCPDTNNHSNSCWTWSEQPPCRDLASNNMMDYNTYQIALTPCQIGRIHAIFANEKSPIRRCLLQTWCSRNPAKDLIIRDSVTWVGARDLEGSLTIAPGGSLRLSCRVSIPAGGRITIQPGGRLWLDGARLHNACGLQWDGIFIQEKKGLRGEVIILKTPVLNDCPLEDPPKTRTR